MMPNSPTSIALLNGQCISAQVLSLDSHESDLIVYEVVRLIDGKILFNEGHYARFVKSSQKSNINMNVPFETLCEQFKILISETKTSTGNIKYQLVARKDEKRIDFMMFFVPHSYPNNEQYMQGVNLVCSTASRPNPEAKVVHTDLKNKIDQLIQTTGAYEVILIHPDGYITEGSRSNIFMIKDKTVFTAPESDILAGITYVRVVELCKQCKIEILEKRISKNEMMEMDALFMTGTSPKVLPIRNVDGQNFDIQNPILRQLKSEYEVTIKKYLEKAENFNHR